MVSFVYSFGGGKTDEFWMQLVIIKDVVVVVDSSKGLLRRKISGICVV